MMYDVWCMMYAGQRWLKGSGALKKCAESKESYANYVQMRVHSDFLTEEFTQISKVCVCTYVYMCIVCVCVCVCVCVVVCV